MLPILYSFRRCPYAIRARFALAITSIEVELREVLLSNKPIEMLEASAKGTVPVLILDNDYRKNPTVIDESIEIMNWAFQQNDVLKLIERDDRQQQLQLIAENDQTFKSNLDDYKYHVRFPEHSKEYYRGQCENFLAILESQLSKSKCLFGEKLSFADYAIFPFIRQFANVDINWFKSSKYINLNRWLTMILELELFAIIMQKFEPWK